MAHRIISILTRRWAERKTSVKAIRQSVQNSQSQKERKALSNYYNNMTQILDITNTVDCLNFYRSSIEYTKSKGAITQREYLSLMTQAAEQEKKLTAPAKFEINQTYQSRSICDHECIFEIKVTGKTEKFLYYTYEGEKRKTVIRKDDHGNEYIRPDNYSMAPTFRANRKAVA